MAWGRRKHQNGKKDEKNRWRNFNYPSCWLYYLIDGEIRMEPTTDIIAVLYGDRADLNRCIKSIEENCTDYVLHVMDNNKKNLGFTKANNDAIRRGKAPYIWLINQDAIILPGAQEALIKRLQSGPKVGIAGSMQLDYDDRDLIRHGGTLRAFPAGAHKGGRLSMGHCRFPERNTWINFASVMFKREMVDNIGLMDETMFLLYSDSDYCYEAREAGWEVWYEPQSKVVHRLGKASKSSLDWQQKDMIAFMTKWGITVKDDKYVYSKRFQKLDMFP